MRCCGTRGSRATARRCTRRGETRGVSAVGPTGLTQVWPPTRLVTKLTLAMSAVLDMVMTQVGQLTEQQVQRNRFIAGCGLMAVVAACCLSAVHREDLVWGIARDAREPTTVVCSSTGRMRTRLSRRWWSTSCRSQASRRRIRRGPSRQPCCLRRRRRPQLLRRAGAWAAPTAACSHSPSHSSSRAPSAGCVAARPRDLCMPLVDPEHAPLSLNWWIRLLVMLSTVELAGFAEAEAAGVAAAAGLGRSSGDAHRPAGRWRQQQALQRSHHPCGAPADDRSAGRCSRCVQAAAISNILR